MSKKICFTPKKIRFIKFFLGLFFHYIRQAKKKLFQCFFSEAFADGFPMVIPYFFRFVRVPVVAIVAVAVVVVAVAVDVAVVVYLVVLRSRCRCSSQCFRGAPPLLDFSLQ